VPRVFNKIRFKFLKSKLLSRYITYAFGEIILVVIGILLALQINSCNQEYVNDKKVKVYLENLIIDLENQLENIDAQITYEINQKNYVENILQSYYESSRIELDSVFLMSSSKLVGRKTFNRNDPTYTALLTTGNISLIKEDQLKSELFEYYQKLEQLENMIQFNNTLYVDQVYKPTILQNSYYFNERYQLNDKLVAVAKSKVADEYIELQLINSITHRAILNTNNLSYLNRIKLQTEDLLSLINTVLNDY